MYALIIKLEFLPSGFQIHVKKGLNCYGFVLIVFFSVLKLAQMNITAQLPGWHVTYYKTKISISFMAKSNF